MKSVLFLFITSAMLVSTTLFSQEKTRPSPKKVKETRQSAQWKAYGENITMKKTTMLSKLVKNPKEFVDNEVLFEGTISEVCQNKGCWMVVGDGGE